MTTAASKDLDDQSEDYYVTLKRSVAAEMKSKARPTRNGRRFGPPPKFSPDVAVQIVKHMADGGLLIEIAKRLKTPPSHVWAWEQRYAVFAEALARAKALGAFCLHEQAQQIADELKASDLEPKTGSSLVQLQRLRVETRLRRAAVLNPALSEKAGLSMSVGGDNVKVEIRTFVDPTGGNKDYLNGAPVERGTKAGPIAIEDQQDKT